MKLKELLLKHMVKHLLTICKHELELESLPKIRLLDYSLGSSSFGEFDGEIKVVTKDRHPIDIMRTLAHELVHFKQLKDNIELDGNDGSDTENAANALAGTIMRKFAHQYPDYFLDNIP